MDHAGAEERLVYADWAPLQDQTAQIGVCCFYLDELRNLRWLVAASLSRCANLRRLTLLRHVTRF